MLDENDVLALLAEQGVDFTCIRHEAVFTVAEAEALNLDLCGAQPCKNLYLRDDKKRAYFLLTCPDDTSVDLRLLQKRLGSRRLSFASEADLAAHLGLTKGAVTPLGALNDVEGRVLVVLDERLQGRRIACHPLRNTATVTLEADELVRVLRSEGHRCLWCAVGAA